LSASDPDLPARARVSERKQPLQPHVPKDPLLKEMQ
jgi:hypothetical protein